MAIIYEENKIVLTDESAISFVNKLKSKDLEASKKRDEFIRQAKEKLNIVDNDGVVTINIKKKD